MARVQLSAGQVIVSAILVIAVVSSAVAVAHTKYQSRLLFVNLQEVQKQIDLLDMDWGRLRLELGTWGGQSRVEKLARDRLNMRLPRADEIIVVIH